MKPNTLRVENLSKSFGGICALDLSGLSLDFEPGKVTAILGGNGAGKTTLFNVINGVVAQDSGSLFFGGKNISSWPVWRRCRAGMARLWQDLRLFSDLDCIENVQTAILVQKGENALYALTARQVIHSEERNLREKAVLLLDQVGLASVMGQLASQISYGQQKLLAFARVLAHESMKVVLLDEPMAGLDKNMCQRVASLILSIRNSGAAVVVIEHDLHAIREVVDHAVFLDQGKCLATGSAEELLRDLEIQRRYMGIR